MSTTTLLLTWPFDGATKRCTKCGEVKLHSEFSKDKKTKDGLYGHCKVCVNAQYALKTYGMTVEQREAVRAASKSPDGYKCCPKCKEIKLVSEFHKNSKTKDGLNTWCKNCNKTGRVLREHGITVEQHEAEKAASKPVVSEGYKYCTRCGEIKSITGFNKAKHSSDGLHSHCKECVHAAYILATYGKTVKQYEAEKAAKDAPKARATPGESKYCTKCKQVKPIGEFYKSARKRLCFM
jgi:hypothetical protein